eukprot:6696253-Pyramimonas_sp.AAC.1
MERGGKEKNGTGSKGGQWALSRPSRGRFDPRPGGETGGRGSKEEEEDDGKHHICDPHVYQMLTVG